MIFLLFDRSESEWNVRGKKVIYFVNVINILTLE